MARILLEMGPHNLAMKKLTKYTLSAILGIGLSYNANAISFTLNDEFSGGAQPTGSAFYCATCDGPVMGITGSRKSKPSDNVGSDLGKSAAGRVRKILEEPRVFDKLGFAEGSTASGGPAAGNYRFVLDKMITNGASDFTWPRNCDGEGYNHVPDAGSNCDGEGYNHVPDAGSNCDGEGYNHVPDAGSTIMLMGLALTVLGGVRHKRKL